MVSRWVTMLLFVHCTLVFGGFGEKPPVKWGKVKPSEFGVQLPGSDGTYHAIVLCDYGTVEVTNRTFYSRHMRIRIEDEAGLSYGKVEIPYETRNKHDDVMVLQAQTLLLHNGKTMVIKVPQEQIKDVKIDDNWSKKVIVFPDLEPGTIIEYRYTIASLDFEKLDDWYFQREIPTLWSEVRFQVPRSFAYLVTFQNNRRLSYVEEREFGAILQWLYNTKRRTRDFDLASRDHILYQTPESRYKVWLMSNYKKKIIMRNLPGMANPDGNQVNQDLYPQLRIHLFESYGNLPPEFRPLLITTTEDYSTRSQWELMNDMTAVTGYVHYRLKTWREMNDALLEHDRFGRMLLRNEGGTELFENLSPPGMTARDRITAIYDYIRHTFQWNGTYSMYATVDMTRFLEERNGASADLNLLLIKMLRRAEIEADPLLIRTSDLGRPEKMYPVSNQFNHVIALVHADGKEILLDATSGLADYPMLNRKDVGTEGWVVSSSHPGWINIFPWEDAPLLKDEEAPQFSL